MEQNYSEVMVLCVWIMDIAVGTTIAVKVTTDMPEPKEIKIDQVGVASATEACPNISLPADIETSKKASLMS